MSLEEKKVEVPDAVKQPPAKPATPFNPVLATVIVALIGFFGTTLGTVINNRNQNALEQRKFEADLIKKSLDEQTQDNKIKSLQLLTTLKLIKDEEIKEALNTFLKDTIAAKKDLPSSQLYAQSDIAKYPKVELVKYNQLKYVFPNYTDEKIKSLIEQFNTFLPIYHINTPQRIAAFIAQVSYESNNFSVADENLNYSADGLIRTFPQHFNKDNAASFEHNPEKIANRVYAGRFSNGDEASGDGWKYRSRGYIGLLGKSFYMLLTKTTGKDFINNPDLLNTDYPLTSACWYWVDKGCNEYADKEDLVSIIKRIDGGIYELDARMALYKKVQQALKM